MSHKYNTELLRDNNVKQNFNLELSNSFEALQDPMEIDTLEQCWKQTRNVWKEIIEIVLGKKTRQNKEWISVDTLLKTKERKTCKTAINKSKTGAAKTTAHQKYNKKIEVKSSVEKNRKDFIDNLAKEAAGKMKTSIKKVYNVTRKQTGRQEQQKQQHS